MSDVLLRLMQWMETADIDDADAVLRDAITEIAGLRARLDELRRARPTLTDEEREEIGAAVAFFSRGYGTTADTLRGLLERLG